MGASSSSLQPSEEQPTTHNHSQHTVVTTVDKTRETIPTTVKKAVEKKTTAAEVKLPHNYETILREADSPIDRASVDKLHDQLCVGVFLNQKREKYWLDKDSNGNSFMLFARDFLITWSDDYRFWRWSSISETETSVEAAELLNVCWLEVHGKFNTTKLSPGILYEVVFVVLLKDGGHGWEVPVNVRLTLPNGIKLERKENLMTKPGGKWIEIPVAEFKTSPENMGDVEISMYEYEGGIWKGGLVIKGAAIRPKK